MSSSPEKPKPYPKPTSWWFKNSKALNNIVYSMHLQNLTKQSPPNNLAAPQPKQALIFDHPKLVSDRTSLLSDEILLQILSRLSGSQRNTNSLVSKRWLNLQGRLVRRVKFLSLEGCSRLTTEGLESVIVSWKELESLSVISCNNISRDCEVTPAAIGNLFSTLKDFKWRADTKSLLSASLVGTGMGKRGRFFRKTQDWKKLAGALDSKQ